jgi:hypothetical protein
MLFEIVYGDDTRTWRQTGHWEDLPSDQVQIVDYIQADGDRIRIAGFDFYYLDALIFGGTYDEKGIWPVDGWRYELRPGVRADLIGPSGEIPPGALVKRGTLIPDDLARSIGLTTEWRDWYDQKKAGAL